MSSINSHYTFQYSQPEEYRFSHDSVFLAHRAFEFERENLHRELRVLDLCSGCGIVGLDFLFHAREAGGPVPVHTDFLDVQDVYREHFERNVQSSGFKDLHLKFNVLNYTSVAPETYDLILCNPPYFRRGQGRLSPQSFKSRCRFFLDASSTELWSAAAKALKPRGRAYLLVKEGSDHGHNSLHEIHSTLQEYNNATGRVVGVELVDHIRGTPLVKLEKKS